MREGNLDNPQMRSKEAVQDVKRQALQEKAALKYSENSSFVNREQKNRNLVKKRFLSEKKIYEQRVMKVQSEKQSSEEYCPDLEEKFNRAKESLNFAQSSYQSSLKTRNLLLGIHQFCVVTNSNKKDEIAGMLQWAQKQCEQSSQRLRRAEAKFKKIEQAYQKQEKIHKKLLMKNFMI